LNVFNQDITNILNKEDTKIIKDEIKKNLECILQEKIKELNNIDSVFKTKGTKITNEFSNLVFDSVLVIHTTYDKENAFKKEKEDINLKQYFKISSKTKFETLKKTACLFWDLKEEEYIITDEVEAIIYDEKILIEEFLRKYSVQINTFRLIHINTLKGRNKLIQAQEHVLRETSYGNKDRKIEVNYVYNKYRINIQETQLLINQFI